MTTTPNLGLQKPGDDGVLDIKVIDANMDIIDGAVGYVQTGKEPAFTKNSGFNKNKSDSYSLDDSNVLATSKALKQGIASITTQQPGEICFFSMSSSPTGFLKANGSAISRTTYANLFNAIGTTFGSGDGSTTFNIPDLRGEFIRGLDDGRGVDIGRALGVFQGDSVEDLYAQITNVGQWRLKHINTPTWSASKYQTDGAGNTTSTNTTGAAIESLGTGENRPRNISMLACIKY